jgi:hypothetical protein
MLGEHHRVSASGLLLVSLRTTLCSGALWSPALLLLLPTLALQLAAPHYLRTRLSPSPWVVIAGSLTIVLLTQIVMPAIFAMVHARRTGVQSPALAPTLSLSLRAGIRAFVGLLLGLIPGLWLQARYAFVAIPIDAVGAEGPATSARLTRGRMGKLMLCGTVALIASALGQSVVAVLNDALAVVRPTGSFDGRAVFSLHYGYHALTTMIAYGCAAGAATLHAVGVSIVRQTVDEGAAVPGENRTMRRADWQWPAAATRVAIVASIALLVAGLAAAAYKIQQHIS